jgi:hypothetical protein
MVLYEALPIVNAVAPCPAILGETEGVNGNCAIVFSRFLQVCAL